MMAMILSSHVLLIISEHKIVMVGLDNAGKTTILYQFLMNEVVHTSPTIGSNVEEVTFRNIHFLVWDLGGQQSLRSAWSTYYTNTEVFESRMCIVGNSKSPQIHQQQVPLFNLCNTCSLS